MNPDLLAFAEWLGELLESVLTLDQTLPPLGLRVRYGPPSGWSVERTSGAKLGPQPNVARLLEMAPDLAHVTALLLRAVLAEQDFENHWRQERGAISLKEFADTAVALCERAVKSQAEALQAASELAERY